MPGQRHIKRVVAELGGKNCVIVDADADLDEAVPAIVSSAFVYAGQKCSAAARVLVHEAIADKLIERMAGAASVLVVGQADELGTEVPPVIERTAQERVQRYAELGRASRVGSSPGPSRCRRAAGSARRRSRPTFRADSAGAPDESVRAAAGDRTRRDIEQALRHRRRASATR